MTEKNLPPYNESQSKAQKTNFGQEKDPDILKRYNIGGNADEDENSSADDVIGPTEDQLREYFARMSDVTINLTEQQLLCPNSFKIVQEAAARAQKGAKSSKKDLIRGG